MKTYGYIKIVMFAAILSLTGCKLGRSYQRPDLDMPELYLKDSESPLGEMKWWDVYADTTLQHLILTALENNKNILASEYRMNELKVRKRITLARFFPNVMGKAYSQNETNNYGGDNSVNEPEHGLKLSALWELDVWGNKRWHHDLSKAKWREEVEAYRGMMISIIADVAIAYYELAAIENELETVSRTAEALQSDIDLFKIELDSGIIDEMTYQRAQVEYSRAAKMIPELEKDIVAKQNELSLLCGKYPGTVTNIERQEEEIKFDTLPDQLSSKLLERRPDIRAAEQRLIGANATVGIKYTDQFPSFSLLASGGLESDDFKTLLSSPWHLLSPSVDVPVFNLGQLNAEYKASKRLYDSEVQKYEQVVLSAFAEVSDALSAFNKSLDIYETSVKYREAAAKVAETARTEFFEGNIDYYELVDAQRDYIDAQISVINAVRDRHLTLITLYKTLGGGWD